MKFIQRISKHLLVYVSKRFQRMDILFNKLMYRFNFSLNFTFEQTHIFVYALSVAE